MSRTSRKRAFDISKKVRKSKLGFHPQTIGWDLANLGNWSGTDGYSRFTDFDGDEEVDCGEYCGAWHG